MPIQDLNRILAQNQISKVLRRTPSMAPSPLISPFWSGGGEKYDRHEGTGFGSSGDAGSSLCVSAAPVSFLTFSNTQHTGQQITARCSGISGHCSSSFRSFRQERNASFLEPTQNEVLLTLLDRRPATRVLNRACDVAVACCCRVVQMRKIDPTCHCDMGVKS